MAQQVLKVPPTKNTLLKVPPTKNTLLKKQVKFLEEGHDLLERKRELLTRLVYERIGEYRRLRQDRPSGPGRRPTAASAITHLRMGSRGCTRPRSAPSPRCGWTSCRAAPWAWNIPRSPANAYRCSPSGLLGTDSSFDTPANISPTPPVLLAQLGEVEIALHRLMEEQRKAQKRVNALKYNIIPLYRRTIHFIQSALEEEERNTLFQVKMLRERQNDRREQRAAR
jgi:V/A-type H+-transporting ATPase subunit D